MEVDKIQTPQPYKLEELHKGVGVGPTTATPAAVLENGGGGGGGGEVVAGGNKYLQQWQNSSRIIRVSRASGGKDRHSKVWTMKGPRDRRVRLSVNTAIQFYDLQDRLGVDQPSKAVEWLIKAAAEAINELPSLSCNNLPSFETPSDDLVVDSGDTELDGDPNFTQNQPQQGLGSLSLLKSGCSSNNSETSKGSGSGLCLTRSENRVKARERARERTAKEKGRENEPPSNSRVLGFPNQPETSSFTRLLTSGFSNNRGETSAHDLHEVGLFLKQESVGNQWFSTSSSTAAAMDYQIQIGNPSSSSSSQMMIENNHGQSHDELNDQQFPFGSDQYYNGFNRGTLQSNSPPSLLPYGSTVPFFLGGTAATENHHHHHDNHHHHHQFHPPGLQLCCRQSDQKGKRKN